MPKFLPRPCARCKRPFTPTGPAAKFCGACPRVGKNDAREKRKSAAVSTTKPAVRPKPTTTNGVDTSLAARIRGLREAAEAGRRAQAQLDAIREALG